VTEKENGLGKIAEEIKDFNQARGWNPVPTDVAKSIVIEGAELLEHFQWEGSGSKSQPKDWAKVGEEVADVFIYLVIFCQVANIDLIMAVMDKMRKNEEKYPVEKFRNGPNHEFYLEQKKKYRKNK